MRRNVRKINREVGNIIGGSIPLNPATAPILEAVTSAARATNAEEALKAAANAVAVATATAAGFNNNDVVHIISDNTKQNNNQVPAISIDTITALSSTKKLPLKPGDALMSYKMDSKKKSKARKATNIAGNIYIFVYVIFIINFI